MSNYNFGSSVRLQATFKDASGTVANPTVVTLRVADPGGATNSYTGAQLTNPSTGVYYRDMTANIGGMWRFYFESVGVVTAGGGGEMTVSPAVA